MRKVACADEDISEEVSSVKGQCGGVCAGVSCRVVLALVMAMGYTMFYLLRINMSVAIVCMNASPSTGPAPANLSVSATSPTIRATNESMCSEMEDVQTRIHSTGEFDWSSQLKGYVLSSFYYGYIVTQIPGGWLAGRFGGKHVFGGGVLISIIATMLIPVAARTSVYLVIALRVIMGLSMGVGFPATHTLWARWAPPMERSKLIAFSYAGTMLGTIMAMGLSGLLCVSGVDNGWPLIFYVYGGVGLLWYIAWNLLVFDSPAQHPRVTKREMDYIHSTIGPSAYVRKVETPWGRILSSPATWAVIIGHMCNNWGSYTILSCIPMYMKDVLKYDIKSNGMLSALPYVTMYLAAVGVSQLADWMRTRHYLSTVAVRRLYQTISFLVPSVLIIAMGFMDCTQRRTAVILLTVAVTATAFGRSGYSVNHVDIAPRFAGVLFGISNTAATIPGMVSPVIVGALTPNGTQAEWQRVFFITGGVYAAGAVVFNLLVRGEVQSWAEVAPQPDGVALNTKHTAKDT